MKAHKVTIHDIELNIDEPGGSVFYSLNPGNDVAEVLIHPDGEIDLYGNFNEDEMSAILEDFYSNPEVEKYFPESREPLMMERCMGYSKMFITTQTLKVCDTTI